VRQLAALLRAEKKEWIPLDDDDIESIAQKITFGKRKRVGFTTYKLGEIKTIFHELIADFAIRKYAVNKGIIAVQTNPYFYSYFILPKYTEIHINGKRFAYVLANGTIKNGTGKKVIGRIDKTDISHPEILIGDNNFGILNKPSARAQPHERAIQMMRKMDEGVQELFVSILFLYQITKQSDVNAFVDL
jgi:hypothetical protein